MNSQDSLNARIDKALLKFRDICPLDNTAIRYKKGVGAFVCARGHIVGIDVTPEELKNR